MLEGCETGAEGAGEEARGLQARRSIYIIYQISDTITIFAKFTKPTPRINLFFGWSQKPDVS